MRRWHGVVVALALMTAAVAEATFAAEKTEQGVPSADRNWQLGFTPSYSRGTFGTGTTSTFFYAPLSIRRLFKDGDVTLIVPFVTATTDGRTTLVGGQGTRIDDGSGSNSGPGGGGSSGGSDDGGCSGKGSGVRGRDRVCGLTTRSAGQTVTTAGLGDLILRGRYYAVDETEVVPLIAVTGRVKFPTASASQGLGTGALDYGVGIEMSKLLGEHWIAFLDGGYNVIGDPDGLQLQNQHWYDVGAGYYITRDLLFSVYFEEYRAILPGFVNARDFLFAVNYTASAAWRFNASVTVGVSNGAPDHMFSVGGSYRF